MVWMVGLNSFFLSRINFLLDQCFSRSDWFCFTQGYSVVSKYYPSYNTSSIKVRLTTETGFVKPKRWAHVCGHIFFSLLTSLFEHQSGHSFYLALEFCNRKNFNQFWLSTNENFSFLTDREHHYAFNSTLWPIFGLPNATGMWPREHHLTTWPPFWFDKQSHVTRIVNVSSVPFSYLSKGHSACNLLTCLFQNNNQLTLRLVVINCSLNRTAECS